MLNRGLSSRKRVTTTRCGVPTCTGVLEEVVCPPTGKTASSLAFTGFVSLPSNAYALVRKI